MVTILITPPTLCQVCLQAGADPGFPAGGDANDSVKMSPKLHEIEKILGRGGGGGHVLGHPLGSATDKECCKTAPPHLSPWIPTTPRPP